MSKQALNYLLGELETMGYVERRSNRGSPRRLVFLTERGVKAVDAHRSAVRDVEAEWAKKVGSAAFREFKTVLRQLAQEPGQVAAEMVRAP